ncbi:unnamed protein product [Prorocentrum cordatum]|uniref:Protein phosphatase n=1 Tax=Prorocentrum cordatum TaxID=2364126 RepID=A0ABN9UJR9_9DINO|nr:unnamed protein product [Polarella glacialis]
MMMQGLRGSGLNDSDRQAEGVEMALVDIPTDDETGLPLTYDVKLLQEFFDSKPLAQAQRIFQIATTGWPLFAGVLGDQLLGRSGPDVQVERAAQFNGVVTTLGPFFIKLGQALSIRPDVLSPRAMVELQKLCDKVPSYPSKMAMATLEKELGEKFGRPTVKEDIFETMTAEPVAAASLGQRTAVPGDGARRARSPGRRPEMPLAEPVAAVAVERSWGALGRAAVAQMQGRSPSYEDAHLVSQDRARRMRRLRRPPRRGGRGLRRGPPAPARGGRGSADGRGIAGRVRRVRRGSMRRALPRAAAAQGSSAALALARELQGGPGGGLSVVVANCGDARAVLWRRGPDEIEERRGTTGRATLRSARA